jgi:hypothetical protein
VGGEGADRFVLVESPVQELCRDLGAALELLGLADLAAQYLRWC